jgi:hypothetical protein
MGHYPWLTVFFVPDASLGTQCCTIESRTATLLHPRFQDQDQIPPKLPDQARQGHGQALQAPFPGAPAWKPAVFGQQRSQLTRHRVLRLHKCQQRPGRIQPSNNHHPQCLHQQPVGVNLRPATRPFARDRNQRYSVNHLDQADKNVASKYPFSAFLSVEVCTLKAYEGSPTRASPVCDSSIKSIT